MQYILGYIVYVVIIQLLFPSELSPAHGIWKSANHMLILLNTSPVNVPLLPLGGTHKSCGCVQEGRKRPSVLSPAGVRHAFVIW